MQISKTKQKEKEKLYVLFMLSCEDGNIESMQDISKKLTPQDFEFIDHYYNPLHTAVKSKQ